MFGKRIIELRKENGMTQTELARSIGISRSALSLYEIEKREPDIETLNKLASLFNVCVDYLTGHSYSRFPVENLEWQYPHVFNRLGNILIKYRKSANLSQENFSKVLGISHETYVGIENGNFIPSMQLIQKIASITSYEIDYLTGAIDHTAIPAIESTNTGEQGFSVYYSESDITFRSRFEELCLKNNITVENCEQNLAFTREEFIDVQYNRMPILSELLRISYSFNVSIDYLIGRTDSPMLRLTDDELSLVLNYRDCPPHYRKNIFDRAEKLSIESIDESVAADPIPLNKTGTTNSAK